MALHWGRKDVESKCFSRRLMIRMAAKIIINTERCKGCGLCVKVCPRNTIVMSKHSNKAGYFPAAATGDGCTGCARCAIICPEAVIEVQKDDSIVTIDAKKKAAGKTGRMETESKGCGVSKDKL